MRQVSSVVVVVLAALLGGPPLAGQAALPAPRGKLDAFLQNVERTAAPGDRVRIIVSARPGARAQVRAGLAVPGIEIVRDHPLIDAVAADVPVAALASVALRADVQGVSVDAPVRGTTETIPLLLDNMLLPTLGLSGSTDVGGDVGVAVVDSGIVAHTQVPVFAFFDVPDKGSVKVAKPFDEYGHGTHVAGLIRNRDDRLDARYHSVARGSRLIGYRALGATGAGMTSTVIAAIEHAVANRSQLRIDVLNLSLGHPIYEPASTDPLVRAVERAVAEGIVVVVSAGNEGRNRTTGQVGYAGITSPGNAPSAITVGAVDTRNTLTRSDDAVAPFSSRGPTWYDAHAKPDVVAPGRRIVSFMSKNSYLHKNVTPWVETLGGLYMSLSGTSMAAAVTSGVVADVIAASRAANGGLTPTPNTVKAILQFTAVQIPGADELTQGAGSINPAGAIALARRIMTGHPVSTWWLSSYLSPATLLSNLELLPWSERVIWGHRPLAGDYMYVHEPAWGPQVVWGDSTPWGGRVQWNSSTEGVVWDNRLIWGVRLVWGLDVLGFETDGGLLFGGDIDWQQVTAERLVWGFLGGSTDESAPSSGQVY